MNQIKKIVFLILLLSIWYYLFIPYFKNFKSFEEGAKNIPKDNTKLFTPKSGREILPIEAQVALFAIDTFHFKDFKLYQTLGDYAHASDEIVGIYQRINESAWPVKLDTTSRNLIGYTNEISTVPGINILLQYNNISVGTY
jgi:hypothetical protein